MLEGRGRPRKVMPVHPNLVLTRALKTALSTAVYLQRALKNKNTAHLYDSSRRSLRRAERRYLRLKAHGAAHYTHLARAEHTIRKNSLQMLFENAAAYENRETRRVKSSDKTVGPLNQRLNIGGAALRDFGMTMFPFPDQVPLRGSPDVTYGYPEDSLCHEVVPIHNIPELDFIDACRQHMQVLTTWCYVFDVPLNDTAKYANLFLLRARPYLERIYSENRYGEPGFREGTIRILRELKDDIARHYRVRSGDTPTVTSASEHREPEYSTDFFRDQMREAREQGIVSGAMDEVDRILAGGSIIKTMPDEETLEERPAPCLTDEDVRYIWQRLFELSGQKGSQVHRQITSLFPSHWNIGRAIRFGDELGGEDGYLLCSEIPIDTRLGKGRIDLVLLRRVVTPDGLNVFWKPVFILDIKTRQGYSWDLGHETRESKSRRRHGLPLREIPEFIISERAFDDIEWRALLEGNPTDTAVTQVDAYAAAAAEAYQEISQTEKPAAILKGTLLVDASDDIRLIRSVVRSFVIAVFERAAELDDKIPRTLFSVTVNERVPRAAIVLHEQQNPEPSQLVSFPAPIVPMQDPFEMLVQTDRDFTLYLSAEPPTSGGTSAAWISKYYHGLEYVNEWKNRTGKSNILWIDLADEFVEAGFRECRLYLRPRSGIPRDQARCHAVSERTIFDSINVMGLFQRVQDYLFKDRPIPTIQTEKRPDLIVVSGWDRVFGSTPSPYDERLGELKSSLVGQLIEGSDASLLWFDDPIPGEQNSGVYATRTLVPYHRESPFFGQVTQIIWSLPVAPESEILPDEWVLPYAATAPLYDDVRIIVTQKQREFVAELANVPPVVGWSRKFRSELLEPELESIMDEPIPQSDIRGRIKILAFDLIPWLPDLWPLSSVGTDNERSVHQLLRELRGEYRVPRNQIVVTSELLTEAVQEPQLLERMRFRPRGPKSGKSYASLALGTINSHRLYRSPYSIKSKERSSYKSTEPTDNEQDVKFLFGRMFTRVTPETQDELLVIEDQTDSTRLLIGHFSESSRKDQSGFLWSEKDNDRLLSLLEEFDSLVTDDILVRITENQEELWRWDTDVKQWRPRSIIEIVSSRVGRVGAIHGIREGLLDSRERVVSESGLSQSFNHRVRQSLYQLIEQEKLRRPVKISLERKNAFCNIRLQQPTDDGLIHLVGVQSVPDLINTLRLPFQEHRTLRLEDGSQLSWNPFTDIEYGEFEIIRPYVETNAPRDVGRSLPKSIEELVETGEEQTLELVLGHDQSSCPLLLNTGMFHDRCWTITLRNSSLVMPQFETPMSGKEVYGHLTTGKMRNGQQTYNTELLLKYSKDSREFYVYHEDAWIRRLLREMNMSLKKLVPGTYLRDDERWIIDYVVQGNDVEWAGVSTISGIHWKSRVFQFRLNPASNLEQAKSEFLDSIAAEIPFDSILNLNELDREIETILSNRGYGKEGPQCRLSVLCEDRKITVILSEVSGLQPRIVDRNSFIIEKTDSREAILEGFYYRFESGDLSNYHIINEKEFFNTLETLLDKIGFREDD
ncbi:MAG: hypothetical protein C4K48_02380 [Candidatus Thorarchaeota archaeon]|nr:MAG: hypothetical protein C4K48_02380 [Candidatus Thorarchaeota archaeon]